MGSESRRPNLQTSTAQARYRSGGGVEHRASSRLHKGLLDGNPSPSQVRFAKVFLAEGAPTAFLDG